MASTYTTGFGIEKIGTGEQAGAWGTTTNHNADILDRLASYTAVALTGTTHTLTVREASPGSGTENLQDGMYRVIKFTGALGANNTVTIAPNTSPAWFIIENATTDSGSSGPYSVILTQGSGANVTVQNGKNAIIYCDGAGAGAVVYDALADLQVGTLEVTGAAAIDGALTAAAISATTLTTSGIASIDDTTDTTSGTTGSIHTDGGLGVAKNLFVATNATVSGTTLMTGVTTHGGNVVSDTDSTDDLGTTGVRWANLFVDGITATDQITATGFTGTLDGILGSGSPAAATVTTLTASGVTTVQAGTALLPSIVPTGDTNTGVWFPAADTVAASTAGTERMRIDSTGLVGIGNVAPSYLLDLYKAASTVARVRNTAATGGTPSTTHGEFVIESTDGNMGMQFLGSTTADQRILFSDTAASSGQIVYDHTSNYMALFTNAAERMRIDSSGNIGVGTSSPDGKLNVQRTAASAGWIINGQTVGLANDSGLYMDASNNIEMAVRNGSATITAAVKSSGSTFFNGGDVGIGTSSPSTLLHLASAGSAILTLEADTNNITESDNARIELSQDGGATTGHLGYGNNTNGIDVWNDYNDYVRIGTNNTERLRIVNDGVVRPGADNTQSLGSAAYRWSTVYAGTGTINTSDEREKQQIADLDDAERRVAVAIKGLVKKYKYNDAVALKGDDARIHVGVIAQEVIAAFAAEGLDATRYALLCHDTWEAEPEEVDKNGNVINPGIEAGERYGIRYDELLAFMIAAL
jgi:hypothetical protein